MSEVEAGREKVSLFELAWTFNHIALASFGGGLSAWSREVLVVEKEWMAEEEPFLTDQKPWERADLVVAGTPQISFDPVTELVVAQPRP